MPIHGRPFEKGNMYIHFTGNCVDLVTFSGEMHGVDVLEQAASPVPPL